MKSKAVYYVTMVDPNCPDEESDMGCFETEEKADNFIAKQRVHYSDRMEWITETRYYHGAE
jgi:hypothetical protein